MAPGINHPISILRRCGHRSCGKVEIGALPRRKGDTEAVPCAIGNRVAGTDRANHEPVMKGHFSDRSMQRPYSVHIKLMTRQERVMAEFIRSGLIVLMGMTVMAAGIFVVFYG